MNSRTTRKSNRVIPQARVASTCAAAPRPLLDVHLGMSLWKSRRVAVGTKLIAIVMGMATVFALVALACLVAAVVDGRAAAVSVSLNPVPLSTGAALFGTIALLRVAPSHVVRLMQLEMTGAIPLRQRSR